MPEVAQADLEAFGSAVRAARIRQGWTLETLGREALARNEAKGFLSKIENGKRQISPLTAGKLARVLDLPDSALTPFLNLPEAAEDEVTAEDRDAERLIRLTERDETVPPPAEALLVSLAYEFAQGTQGELITAYNGLRAALQAAADIKARGQMPQNVDDQLQAVMQRVAELNDRGQREEAADALDDAMQGIVAERERLDAEREAIFRLQLDQDRVLNRPETAAKRLVAHLRASAPPGGVFRATHALLGEWRERGETQGSPFDLHVALHLARINRDRAKGAHKLAALDLGRCHLRLGERSAGNLHLTKSVCIFSEILKRTPRDDPQFRAAVQSSFGIALWMLGERGQDSDRLNRGITVLRAAPKVFPPKAAPTAWAMTQNNLGNALSALGDLEQDPAPLREAMLAPDPALLATARDHALAARAVFAEGSEHQNRALRRTARADRRGGREDLTARSDGNRHTELTGTAPEAQILLSAKGLD